MLKQEELEKLWEHIAVNRGNGLQITAMTIYNALHESYEQNRRQNERIDQLEKALEWYENEVNYSPYNLLELPINVIADKGKRARQALGREE